MANIKDISYEELVDELRLRNSAKKVAVNLGGRDPFAQGKFYLHPKADSSSFPINLDKVYYIERNPTAAFISFWIYDDTTKGSIVWSFQSMAERDACWDDLIKQTL